MESWCFRSNAGFSEIRLTLENRSAQLTQEQRSKGWLLDLALYMVVSYNIDWSFGTVSNLFKVIFTLYLLLPETETAGIHCLSGN